MTPTAAFTGRRMMLVCLLATFTLIAYVPRSSAQDSPSESKGTDEMEYRAFYPANSTQDAVNEITTALRNMLPRAKIYSGYSLGAITIRGSADDLQLAQRIIADIDRPAKTYRLTFTLNESGADKPAGSRRLAMLIQVGGKSEVKQGSKVPIVTGSFDQDNSKTNTQVQYLDVGLNIQAWLDRSGDVLRLRTKIEQSSVAEEKSNVGIQDPVLHQAVLDGQSSLVESKPLVLGTLESPGGSGKVEIEVVAEQVK